MTARDVCGQRAGSSLKCGRCGKCLANPLTFLAAGGAREVREVVCKSLILLRAVRGKCVPMYYIHTGRRPMGRPAACGVRVKP